MSGARLFTPLEVGGLALANRIVVAPMCQYSAVDGCMTDWHVIHLGHLALSGTDWAQGGWDIEQTVVLAKALEARGCAGMHVSSGGLTPDARIPVGPSFQVPLARTVKRATRMPVITVGMISAFEQAEAIVGTGDADLVALARAILYDPRWPWHAAAHFGAHVGAPNQYLRSQPSQVPDLFAVRADE